LLPEAPRGALRFQPLHKGPKLLCFTGVHHVVRAEAGRGGELRVQKPGGDPASTFSEGETPIALEHLLGMAFSHSERSLVYSVRPNVWTIPASHETLARHGLDAWPPAREITLAPHETLLAGRIDPHGATARIWSDARYGGDGTIRTERRAGREATMKQPIKLGPDALRVVKVDAGHGGVWSLVADDDGEPQELRLHRPSGSAKHPAFTAIDLRDALQQATVVDLDAAHG
jgi:hypothetical protein